jgi:Rps23 Pro-64 3,4-dihydroxylase Tpa1-like proline 4-hydroxylase
MIRQESIDTVRQGYRTTTPFPHIVVDNFLSPDALCSVYHSVRSLRSEDATSKFINPHSPYEYNKYAFDSGFDETLKTLFDTLVSDDFTSAIESLTGISPLIRGDTRLLGAGVHRIHSGGFLRSHTDFNTYDHPVHGKLDRRINLLLYLNPNWKEEYKGNLLLADGNRVVHSIQPILNRCVIFNTTNKSVHGHPEPLQTPEGLCRESVAVYYYTKNTNGPVDFEGDEPHSTIWYKTE